MNHRIKYISHYGCKDAWRRRDNSPASDSKKDYLFEVINRCGYGVDHISRAFGSVKGQYIPSYVEKRGINTFRYFSTFGLQTNPILRVLNRWFVHIQFFFWLLFNLKKGEQIMIYHSLGYDSTFILLKKIKKLRIIGEIEEIYQDVHSYSNRVCKNEFKFIDICDDLVFPNTTLNERLNHNGRTNITVHGIYQVNNYIPASFNDGKIHVLYAGTFDPVKGGAKAAVQAAEFLSDSYHLHITGFGSEELADNLKKEIERVQPLTKAAITFHGFLNDKEFLDLMHHCTIGLCTQDPTNKLNLTSFPSKILNYMANGLVVLSGRNKAIEESRVGDIVYYYDEQTPQSMANAIMSIKSPNGEIGKERLRTLDKIFEQEIRSILKN
ncbi:MAG: glycosyltransferase [Lachnospiraceae bacterium]|nr:glycosyltransferase [Lachnospiraceae bacterium]